MQCLVIIIVLYAILVGLYACDHCRRRPVKLGVESFTSALTQSIPPATANDEGMVRLLARREISNLGEPAEPLSNEEHEKLREWCDNSDGYAFAMTYIQYMVWKGIFERAKLLLRRWERQSDAFIKIGRELDTARRDGKPIDEFDEYRLRRWHVATRKSRGVDDDDKE